MEGAAAAARKRSRPGTANGGSAGGKRSRAECDERLTEKISAKLDERFERLIEKISAKLQGRITTLQEQIKQICNQLQAAPVILGVSPPQCRSSCTSTSLSEHSDVQLPIDDIQEPTPCKLQVRMIGSISIEAGRGMAFPCQEETVLHGAQLAQGYAKVKVDMVHDNFMAVPLEKPLNEDIITLGDAVHTFVQWPKRDIALDPAVPRSSHGHTSPTEPSMTPPQPPLQKAVVSVPVETPPKKQEKHADLSPGKTNSR